MKFPILIMTSLILSGCATHIHPTNEAILPSKKPLGSFKSVRISPLVVSHSEGDKGDAKAVELMQTKLNQCLNSIFGKNVEQNDAKADERLLVSPSIIDLKKVTAAERVFLGALAGSSAVLLRTRYTVESSGEELAAPTFYAKASAMSGAWSFGSNDNAMLSRIVTSACDYARNNY
ncbi:hypothetical protein [Candidatus Magnetaquicoccus inordinatus]|uniref:hypothetical protein n=1 Tax=Candidatus Magnetaquicoccus inordinatus TaxID=2496818 RepID=UPI00102B176E|nr:hypothetical protein [Candidatus Magnetaquicoccus inordinatus]